MNNLNSNSVKHFVVPISDIDITSKSQAGEVYYARTNITAQSLGLNKIIGVSIGSWYGLNGATVPYIVKENDYNIGLMCSVSSTIAQIEIHIIGN